MNILTNTKILLTIFLLSLGYAFNSTTVEYHRDIDYSIKHNLLTKNILGQAKNLKQIDCLARNVYYEARGESFEGQMAVAQVTLNRVNSDQFPNSICSVVEEKTTARGYTVCQFSWVCEPWNNQRLKVRDTHTSYQVAYMAIMGQNALPWMTENTFWFHATHVKPKWRHIHDKVARVDNHIFYKQK